MATISQAEAGRLRQLILFRRRVRGGKRTGGIARYERKPDVRQRKIRALSGAFAWQLNNRAIGSRRRSKRAQILDRRPSPIRAPVYRASRPHVSAHAWIVLSSTDVLRQALSPGGRRRVAIAVPRRSLLWGRSHRKSRC